MNLGRKWGDDAEAVDENLRRLCEAGCFGLDSLRRVKQVHGAQVLAATELGPASEADALWARRAEAQVVAVATADCVPVLLADRAGTVCAAVHSGWRSTVAQVVRNTVAALGVDPTTLVAAIGPCIEQPRFEVGPEVAEQFEERFVDRSRTKPHVDLVGVVRSQLEACGVGPTSIERVGSCTHTHEERYFSYRRDGAGTGQMLSFIGYPLGVPQ